MNARTAAGSALLLLSRHLGMFITMSSVLCGKPTPAGPCRRRVSAPGGLCGSAHPNSTPPTVTASAAPVVAGPDPLAAYWPTWLQDPAVVGNPGVRARVAEATGDQVALAALAGDVAAAVRSQVAANSATPPGALVALAEDPESEVRSRVAGNSATPPEVLGALATDPSTFVAETAVSNPMTPPAVLAWAAGEGQAVSVHRRVAANSATPPDILARFAEGDDPVCRLAVAKNPSTPDPVLVAFASDPDRFIRDAAAANPNLPPAGRAAVGLLND